jgi:hypothetical protein
MDDENQQPFERELAEKNNEEIQESSHEVVVEHTRTREKGEKKKKEKKQKKNKKKRKKKSYE